MSLLKSPILNIEEIIFDSASNVVFTETNIITNTIDPGVTYENLKFNEFEIDDSIFVPSGTELNDLTTYEKLSKDKNKVQVITRRQTNTDDINSMLFVPSESQKSDNIALSS